MSFYTKEELKVIGLKKYGEKVLISKNASIYGAENIEIGDNVRIDDFCILSGNIILGSNIHISAGVYLYGGKKGIELKNNSGISSRSILYSVTDDFNKNSLIGSQFLLSKRNLIEGKILLEEYVQLGANTIVMPNITIKKGAVTGTFTFVNKNLEEWGIYTGIPAKRIKQRSLDGE